MIQNTEKSKEVPESVKFILFLQPAPKTELVVDFFVINSSIFLNSLIRGHFGQNFCKNGYTK